MTKRSKDYVPYLYTQIKNKSTTAYITKKKGGDTSITASKGTLQFKYVSKE